MKIQILKEYGYIESLLGLSLNKNSDIEKMTEVARRLSNKDAGHNKFLESIFVWVDLTAPRYFWQEFDTYRVGISKQSESTIHTGKKKILKQEDFVTPIPENYLELLNEIRLSGDLQYLKALLPEGFLQRRLVCMNYKCLRNIYQQRKNHTLLEWKEFCAFFEKNLEHFEFLS